MYKRQLHGKGIAAALEVHVAEDAAAHNGQVRIAAAGVVGEQRHKIEQLLKGAGRDGHGRRLMGEHDAVPVSYTHLDVYKRQLLILH